MKHIYTFILLFIGLSITAQNTIGVLKNDAGAYDGYTLLAPINSKEIYLINNCGEVVQQWTSTRNAGVSAYLLENGNLLRTGSIKNEDIQFGGVGGAIELYDWDGNLLWDYIYSNTQVSQHHDIYPLANGNILMLAVSTITQTEAIQAGRNPSQIDEGKLYNEQILELQPVGLSDANVVWEWNIKDHLIQDFDLTKDNFGVVENNPQLLDINFLESDEGNANWLHVNSIQYNESLDQIILSSRLLNEIYIIDHSTTSAESASHIGGSYGKGGDFLYRWGNAKSYRHGTIDDQKLFNQHHPHWIPDGLNDAGKIMIFNNGTTRGYSSIDIIDPPVTTPGNYIYDSTSGFSPENPEWSYSNTANPSDFFSAIVSSGQRLPNGNTLICDGDSGYFFEIDPTNTIVWEYINPDSTGGILSQGDTPIANVVFRAHKFSKDYPAFNGRDLTPGDPIELNFDISSCQTLGVNQFEISNSLNLYPNPTNGSISISTELPIDKIEVYDTLGKLIKVKLESKNITIENLNSGIYFMKIYSNNSIGTKKVIKI